MQFFSIICSMIITDQRRTSYGIPQIPVSYTHLDVYKRQLLFCAGGAGFTFLKHGSDKWLLYGAIASGVLAIIYLFLLIAGGRKGDDYEDDYDDPFEDDYADDDY